jgi:class 3 adenylate cyclase
VKCPNCGYDCAPQFAFCPQCATLLAAIADRPPGAIPERLRRLVPQEYAERLLAARGEMAGQRRKVTILMSDVVGSSALLRGRDPEEALDIMDGAFEILIQPIARYEGTVARLEGDAILAFFGAPIAHEDDPERACRAGLDIVEGARAYAERLKAERSISGFSVRVGIHTGLVVVGEVGSDLRMEYTAMGEAPNLTARLESAAHPGTVLVSAETHNLIAPLFETEALEPIEAKGWDEPVEVFRVLTPREVAGKVRGIEGLQSELVGREAEFAALTAALDRLGAGTGGIVTIVGEAGIGKSRLVAELHQSLPDHTLWIEGRCLSYGSSMAYLLWLDVLRNALGATKDDSLDSLSDQPGAGMVHQSPLCPAPVGGLRGRRGGLQPADQAPQPAQHHPGWLQRRATGALWLDGGDQHGQPRACADRGAGGALDT